VDTTLAPTGRVVGVRLTDIPVERRRQYGRALYEEAVAERDMIQAAAINAAIESPSNRVHWISERAYRRVMAARRRR
jgi:hypothetical protein